MRDNSQPKKENRNLMRELTELRDEALERMRREFELSSKIKEGKKQIRKFLKYINENFPLQVLGEDFLNGLLSQNKSEYHIEQAKFDAIGVSRFVPDSLTFSREVIKDAIQVSSALRQLERELEFYEFEKEWVAFLVKLNAKRSLQEKKDYLLRKKFSLEVKSHSHRQHFVANISTELDKLEVDQELEKIVVKVNKIEDQEEKIRFLVESRNDAEKSSPELRDAIVEKINIEIEIIRNISTKFSQMEFLRFNDKGEVNKTAVVILIQIIYLLKLFGQNGKPLTKKKWISFFEEILKINLSSFDKLLTQGLTSYRSEENYIGKEICDTIEKLKHSKQSTS